MTPGSPIVRDGNAGHRQLPVDTVPVMIRKIAELRATPDAVLIAEHDEAAVHTFVGTGYYVEELDRRSRDRATEAALKLAEASHRLAARTFWLAVGSAVLSLVAVVVSVLALVLGG